MACSARAALAMTSPFWPKGMQSELDCGRCTKAGPRTRPRWISLSPNPRLLLPRVGIHLFDGAGDVAIIVSTFAVDGKAEIEGIHRTDRAVAVLLVIH